MTQSSLLLRAREALRTSLWFVPALFAGGALCLWLLAGWLDENWSAEGFPLAFEGGAAGAREVLSAIATSMIAFTGVVFSVTIVALQLAGSQYSPRVLRNFLRDRRTQAALGSFIATFVYALLVLPGVEEPQQGADAAIPRISVSVAFVVLAFSLVMFVIYIHEIAQSIRASHIVQAIGDETRAVLAELTDDEIHESISVPLPDPGTHVALANERAGVVLGFDATRIVDIARRHDTQICAAATPGDFLASGMPLLLSTCGDDDVLPRQLRGTVPTGIDRTMQQDLRFGLRQLADIALRALSPAMNDPTTAVQCLDQLHDVLRRAAQASFRSGVHRDVDGVPRFVERVPAWTELLDLAVTEVRIAGRDHVRVNRRLKAMLDDLQSVARPDRLAAITRQRELMEGARLS